MASKSGLQVFAAALDVGVAVPVFALVYSTGKSSCVFFRVQIDEEIVNFVQHFLRTRVGAVDLVDHDNGR